MTPLPPAPPPLPEPQRLSAPGDEAPLSPREREGPSVPALPEDLTLVLRHLEAAYPEEGCGVLLLGARGWCVRPLGNAYDRFRAHAPGEFPRTAQTAFLVDPREWLQVCTDADAAGEAVVCLFHSHPDGSPTLSEEDRAMAAPDGEPLLPGVSYLVVAVHGRRAASAKLYWWVGGTFAERPVTLRP
ncbi:MAG: M67 family metallopeptidase [Myxococcaceae bacterium]|nr:M67 family metallopeptidase [Myxococcaceae bacterium]MCI0670536.1 M67 family metallopeptidase [Myxococcaceae bacterium]